MQEFTIATPWDDAFLSGLEALNGTGTHARFAEVFGSHRTSITGGGRPAFRLPEVAAERFEHHVRQVRKLGLRFNYVMNAPDLSGLENETKWRHRLVAFVEYLADCGVEKLTIAHPALLELTRTEFPDFRLVVSLIAGVDSVDRAKHYEQLGVEVINLNPFTINRHFEVLGAIRQAVRCKLEVYANIACLDDCPWREAHYLHSGQTSRQGNDTDIGHDPFLRRCSSALLSDPTQLLRSPFIRPEDLPAYWDVGIDLIKLADRTQPSEVLLGVARAYSDGKYTGDLFDLIFRGGRKFRAAAAASCPQARDMAVPIFIDNQALDRIGFIENIRTLRGDELDAFYRRATSQAVSFTDPHLIDRWKELLQPEATEQRCEAGGPVDA